MVKGTEGNGAQDLGAPLTFRLRRPDALPRTDVRGTSVDTLPLDPLGSSGISPATTHVRKKGCAISETLPSGRSSGPADQPAVPRIPSHPAQLVTASEPLPPEIQHEAFIDTIREFAHNMLEQDLFCPVVSVLAT